jgi:hypothetical protein
MDPNASRQNAATSISHRVGGPEATPSPAPLFASRAGIRFGAQKPPSKLEQLVARVEDDIAQEEGGEAVLDVFRAWRRNNLHPMFYPGFVFPRLVELALSESNSAAEDALENMMPFTDDLFKLDLHEMGNRLEVLKGFWDKEGPLVRGYLLPLVVKSTEQLDDSMPDAVEAMETFLHTEQDAIDEAICERFAILRKTDALGILPEDQMLMVYEVLGLCAGKKSLPLIETAWFLEADKSNLISLLAGLRQMIDRRVPGSKKLKNKLQPEIDGFLGPWATQEIQTLQKKSSPKLRFKDTSALKMAVIMGSPLMIKNLTRQLAPTQFKAPELSPKLAKVMLKGVPFSTLSGEERADVREELKSLL